MTFAELVGPDYPWELLLDADPFVDRIRSYLASSVCIGMFDGDLIVGVIVLSSPDLASVEIMNIAIAPAVRGRGYGKQLIEECIRRARAQGVTQIKVGTGNSSLDQLAFYQKCGFRITGVDCDFFLDNYPESIEENGILCRDLVRLTMELD